MSGNGTSSRHLRRRPAALSLSCPMCVLSLAVASSHHHVVAFSVVPSIPIPTTTRVVTTTTSTTALMASSKAQNKQAALRKKLELAKRQSGNLDDNGTTGSSTTIPSTGQETILTEAEIRQRNDRLRFEELLKRGGGGIPNGDENSDGYLSRQQEEDEIDAVRAGKDRIFEGDVAPTDCFEDLVHCTGTSSISSSGNSQTTEQVIGSAGKQRLVPWLSKSTSRQTDYIVVLCDPRPQSVELRDTIKSLSLASLEELPVEHWNRLIVINADSPAENRRWLKKNGLLTRESENDDGNFGTTKQPLQPSSQPTISTIKKKQHLDVYADEKLEWMRSYTALGDARWSMTLFVLQSGKVRKLARDVDRYSASRTLIKAVQAMLDEKYI